MKTQKPAPKPFKNYFDYEVEKLKTKQAGLAPQEYEQQIKKIARKCGV